MMGRKGSDWYHDRRCGIMKAHISDYKQETESGQKVVQIMSTQSLPLRTYFLHQGCSSPELLQTALVTGYQTALVPETMGLFLLQIITYLVWDNGLYSVNYISNKHQLASYQACIVGWSMRTGEFCKEGSPSRQTCPRHRRSKMWLPHQIRYQVMWLT